MVAIAKGLSVFFVLTETAIVNGNIRCFSCAPCFEFEYYVRDVAPYETDCLLDRYCLKVSGSSTDAFGYRQEISFRGCPWATLLPKLEEGCTISSFSVAGLGEIVGEICLCSEPLCNKSFGPVALYPGTVVITLVAILQLR